MEDPRYRQNLVNGHPDRMEPAFERPADPAMLNGMTHTASGKRYPSDDDYDDDDDSYEDDLPAAPEVPKGPPVSYREPGRASSNPVRGGQAGSSFAQRAAAMTGRDIPPTPDPQTQQVNSYPDESRKERRSSLNRPIGGVYNEIAQHRRESYPAGGRSSTAAPAVTRDSHPAQNVESPIVYDTNPPRRFSHDRTEPAQTYPTPQSVPRRSTAPQTDQWADDRSPLQKLEGKFVDISKEEKRARVQEAEQRLKEKKRLGQRDQLGAAGRGINLPGRRASEGVGKSYPASAEPKQRSASAREPPSRPPRDDELARAGRYAGAYDAISGQQQREATVGAQEPPRDDRVSPRTNVAVPEPAQQPRFAPSRAVPPQTQAGVEARQNIGFSHDMQRSGATAEPRRRQMRDFLHRNTPQTNNPTARSASESRVFDEWKRAGVARLTTADLVDEPIDDSAWWERSNARGGNSSRRRSQRRSLGAEDAYPEGTVTSSTSFSPPLHLKCGPLLRYTGMKRVDGPDGESSREVWRGSVMIVTMDSDSTYEPAPILRLYPEPMEKLPAPHQQEAETEHTDDLPLHYKDPVAGLPKLSRTGKTVYVKPVDDLEHGKDLSGLETNDEGLFEDVRSAAVPTAYGTPEYRYGQNGPSPRASGQRLRQKRGHRVRGARLLAEKGVTFWRFNLEVELQDEESRIAYSINNGPAVGFWVPARGQTMNIMFHSCNGFSLSVNPDDFSGPDPLWRDVLNKHQARPFHVMIGGGDQIYNDAVMRQSPLLQQWLDTRNPHHKHNAPFTPELQEQLETVYLERYAMWFSQGLFGMANAQIPMVNIWDDHDIIDGFGSYPHHFMSTPVFCGLGAVAFKYYMLFQHQTIPDETSADEPSWLLGAAPGPYVNELSRSVFMNMGRNVAFLGLDCRTERMRDEVLSEATYQIVFDRCRREIISGDTKHLIVLLGVPIAYPRLVWLENILTSRAMLPLKAVGRTGLLGGFMNKFDGGVEILDDLDDHWTAKHHKNERNWFIQELQELAAEKSVRVTILGGDVHLAAVGQFTSSPRLRIPKDQDHRYMPNVISSAIVNTPPPEMMSDVLNKRNKTHHLDAETDEYMIPLFSHDVDGKSRNNKRLLPRRNWCSITEYQQGATPPPTPPGSEPDEDREHEEASQQFPSFQRSLSLNRDIRPRALLRRLSGREQHRPSIDGDAPESPSQASQRFSLNQPREGRTSQTPSIDAPARPGIMRRPTDSNDRSLIRKKNRDEREGHINIEHSLDVILNCEVDQRNPAGITTPYRFLVPALYYQGHGDREYVKRPGLLQRLSRREVPIDDGHGEERGFDEPRPGLLQRISSYRAPRDVPVDEEREDRGGFDESPRPGLLQRISSMRDRRDPQVEEVPDEQHGGEGMNRSASMRQRFSNLRDRLNERYDDDRDRGDERSFDEEPRPGLSQRISNYRDRRNQPYEEEHGEEERSVEEIPRSTSIRERLRNFGDRRNQPHEEDHPDGERVAAGAAAAAGVVGVARYTSMRQRFSNSRDQRNQPYDEEHEEQRSGEGVNRSTSMRQRFTNLRDRLNERYDDGYDERSFDEEPRPGLLQRISSYRDRRNQPYEEEHEDDRSLEEASRPGLLQRIASHRNRRTQPDEEDHQNERSVEEPPRSNMRQRLSQFRERLNERYDDPRDDRRDFGGTRRPRGDESVADSEETLTQDSKEAPEKPRQRLSFALQNLKRRYLDRDRSPSASPPPSRGADRPPPRVDPFMTPARLDPLPTRPQQVQPPQAPPPPQALPRSYPPPAAPPIPRSQPPAYSQTNSSTTNTPSPPSRRNKLTKADTRRRAAAGSSNHRRGPSEDTYSSGAVTDSDDYHNFINSTNARRLSGGANSSKRSSKVERMLGGGEGNGNRESAYSEQRRRSAGYGDAGDAGEAQGGWRRSLGLFRN